MFVQCDIVQLGCKFDWMYFDWMYSGRLWKRCCNFFPEIPLSCLGSMAAAVQPNCLWNSLKTFHKTFYTTCRPRLHLFPQTGVQLYEVQFRTPLQLALCTPIQIAWMPGYFCNKITYLCLCASMLSSSYDVLSTRWCASGWGENFPE